MGAPLLGVVSGVQADCRTQPRRPMIEVWVYVGNAEEPLGHTKWPAIPDVGDQITLHPVTYEVESRYWGTFCSHNGEIIWGQPVVSLYLKPVR